MQKGPPLISRYYNSTLKQAVTPISLLLTLKKSSPLFYPLKAVMTFFFHRYFRLFVPTCHWQQVDLRGKGSGSWFSYHNNHMPERWIHIGIIYSYSNSNKSVTYLHWKTIDLAGIWTPDLTGTKLICYQLSYPGLDLFF